MFTFDPHFNLDTILTNEATASLKQFGLHHSMKMSRYAFSKAFVPTEVQAFFDEFFTSPELQSTFAIPDMSGNQNIRIPKDVSPGYTELSISSKKFDDLMPAVSAKYVQGETFKGMAPETLQKFDMELNFLLDKDLFSFDDEQDVIFDAAWRSEILNIVFSLLRSGGSLNQQSDKVKEYVDLAVMIYKGVIKPVRLEAEENLTLKHLLAYKINSLGQKFDLFPGNDDGELHPSNICFCVVDTLRRYIYLVYNNIYQ
ncbi:hypothetical protein SS50377_22570 [Spironucleus salmonicida]|uniref:Cilia- and flagella-associated protein 300 n=1 Tax=Spironucleus salmonicida TaxID=348837 RepID=V6LCG1_9EUKA|nr:hypothetical protein SS50377_22570 [Spironucleus salmonicida]|eukprot:EST41938.1 hypothetical protein SS50377_18242 [Spironucleus salmonicida]